MIEGSWDRQPYRISTFAHLHTTPISVDTTLSELGFVSEEHGGATNPSDPELYHSPYSPISELQFASPEETMVLTTPNEPEPLSRDSLSFSTADSSSPGVRDNQARITPSEQFSLTYTTSASQQKPVCVAPGLDRPTTSDSKGIGRRPLPEVPGHTQSRPLPSRPIRTVPGWRGPDRFSYPPRQEFVQGCSKDLPTASRPVSGSGSDTPSKSAEEERLNRDPTPENTPPEHLIPASSAMISPPASFPPLPLYRLLRFFLSTSPNPFARQRIFFLRTALTSSLPPA
jgi:hypothetical protein